jgi:uncharacterized protein (DUF1697 family)
MLTNLEQRSTAERAEESIIVLSAHSMVLWLNHSMRWVVFLRAVNVGGTNRCQPARIAKQLAKFGVINIGAVGTFVVREDVSELVLRAALARKLPFKCEIMIVAASDIIKFASKDPFSRQPSGPNITRFVNILAKRLRAAPSLPLNLPSDDDWLVKIIAIQDRFVLGLYRRQMKAIGYLGKIEKLLGVPATTRNWNTIEKIAKILSQDLTAKSGLRRRGASTRSMAGTRPLVRCTALCSSKSLAA